MNDNPEESLLDEECDYHFFGIEYGSTELREMVIRRLFRDSVSGRKYMVFTPTDDPHDQRVREYFGDHRERCFVRISDQRLRKLISDRMKLSEGYKNRVSESGIPD